MKNRIAIWIVVCFVMSMGVVAVLLAASKDIRQRPGSFLRNFPPHPAREANVLDLKYNSYYIAGGTPHHLYLANYAAPLHMLIVNSTLTDTQRVTLNVKNIDKEKFWAIRIQVDSPYFYLTDGAVPAVYRGSVHDWKAVRYEHNREFFQDIVPVTPSSFFVRSLAKGTRENVLGKIQTDRPGVQLQPGILTKQVDGIFCTDGLMHYNNTRHELLYLYRYRNEFIVLDTTLAVLRRYHTIDTTTRVNIAVSEITSSARTTLASPPRIVNKHSAVWGDFLFVNSMIAARNEHPNATRASVIDVYNLAAGEYRLSFYIHDYMDREKLRMFGVFGDSLYALFDTHIQVWKLKHSYFE